MAIRTLHINEQRAWRGGEQQVAYLVNGLSALGYETHLACNKSGPFPEPGRVSPTVKLHTVPLRNEIDIHSAWNLARIVKRHDIDIIHAHTAHTHTLACLARSISGRPKVLVSRRVINRPRSTGINRYKYRWPDGYIAISECIAEVMVDAGIDRTKIPVIYDAIDPSRFNVDAISRHSLEIPEGVPLLGMVGALASIKGHSTVLRAMPVLADRFPGLQLLIAGEGPLRNELESLAAELGIEAQIHFLGFRNDIPEILKALDVFVMPSEQEGLGTSILDAMAAGVPVVASNVGGIPELVRHLESGLLAESGNSNQFAEYVSTILENPELRESLVKNAKIMVANSFFLDRLITEHIHCYQQVLGRSGTS